MNTSDWKSSPKKKWVSILLLYIFQAHMKLNFQCQNDVNLVYTLTKFTSATLGHFQEENYSGYSSVAINVRKIWCLFHLEKFLRYTVPTQTSGSCKIVENFVCSIEFIITMLCGLVWKSDLKKAIYNRVHILIFFIKI